MAMLELQTIPNVGPAATVDGRPIDDGAPLPAGLGAHTLTVAATDDAGNSHSETRSYLVALL